MSAMLKVFGDAPVGSITRLRFEWAANDAWKSKVMAGLKEDGSPADGDDRVERFDSPQYQSPEDAKVADPACPSCVWL